MNKNGPVIIIEDDLDDQHILTLVFNELNYPNEIVFFPDGETALEYLRQDSVHPFLILSDINMPKLDGFELKQKVQTDARLSRKCLPYLFFTTSANQNAVYDAYKMSVQGFFVKPTGYDQMKNIISSIMNYWQHCYSPDKLVD